MGNADWLFDVFSWDKLSAIITVVAFIGTSLMLPLYNSLRKRQQKAQEIRDKQLEDKIRQMIADGSKHTCDKLTVQGNKIGELQNAIENNNEKTDNLAHSLKTLNTNFEGFRNSQIEINNKIYYIDGVVKSKLDR